MGDIGLGLGGLMILIGIIWMIVIAIQTGRTTGEKVLWALLNLICQPITGIIFYIMRRQGLIPLILIILGYIIASPGYFARVNQMMQNMPK